MTIQKQIAWIGLVIGLWACTVHHMQTSTPLPKKARWVVLPVVNAPFRVFWGYNFLRVNDTVVPPQDYPPESLFPNHATYEAALAAFRGFRLADRRSRLGFTVARTF